jgi:hypothetical protein
MTDPRDSSYIWVTWITALLSADKQCAWSAWFRAHFEHYEKPPSDFDLIGWTAVHGEMVRTRADELRGEGYDVYVEDQNKFSLRGKAATLGGKPDLVAVRDGQALVVDCKSGRQRNSDAFQVLTYMLVLPLTHRACKSVAVAGEVQYREARLPIEPGRLDDEMRGLIRATIERVGGPTPPPKVPSASECRFCDITAGDCPERVEAPRAEPTVVEHDLF